MSTSKIRIASITLVASAGFAIAAAVPAASQAQWLHYCVQGHCVTSPTAPKSTIVGAGTGGCETSKAAAQLPSERDVDTNAEFDHLAAVAIYEVEQERKAEEKRDKEDEKDEEEARAAEAERASFETGCSSAGLHSK